MAENSKIEWTTHTWNGWWGCMKVSPGCAHCYAERDSKRHGRDIFGPAATTERWRTTGPWRDIVKWDRQAKAAGVRQRVFCQSMSDFFEDHPQVVPWREEAINILEDLEWLDVQLLTKRIENVSRMVPKWMENWPKHIWMGTSVENQEMANKRIPELIKIPAAIRFLSIEPMLSRIELGAAFPCGYYCDPGEGYAGHHDHPFWSGWRVDPQIQWVIVGGESGPGARGMDLDWARDLIDQCKAADVPVFVKQLGSVLARELGCKARKGGDIDEWPQDLRIRQFPGDERFKWVEDVGYFAAQWPTLPDLEGTDPFAAAYGEPTGGEHVEPR